MSFSDIGNGFVSHYYNFFANNRAQLAGIYRPSTLLTWQSEQFSGAAAIMERFANLQFTQAVFKTDTVDCQPIITNMANPSAMTHIVIVVNGEVLLKGETHPLKFNDTFVLAQDNGQWFVANQVFNIVGGGGH